MDVAWFADALMSHSRKIYIGYRGIEKIGAVRFDKSEGADDAFLVSIMISLAQRGRGFGKALLSAGIETLPFACLTPEIARHNLASRCIFEACGFQLLTPDINEDLLRYRRAPVA